MGQDNILKFIYRGPSMPLIAYLKSEYLSEFSMKAIKRAIDQKAVKINQKQVMRSNELLTKEAFVTFDLSRLEKREPISILYEDDGLLIINKPPFITSDEDEIQKQLKKKAFLCHRLDKETSGVLILAKNETTKKNIEEQFEKQLIKKRYLAIVKSENSLMPKFSVKAPLAILKKLEHQVVMTTAKVGMKAHTDFSINRSKGNFYLLECFPQTGKTHQIRVHLKEVKAPILGDLVYGKLPSQSGRFLLHAESIQFLNPEKNTLLAIKAPLPKDFLNEIQSLFPS